MRKFWMIIIAVTMVAVLSVGCAKKNGSGTGASASPSVSSTPGGGAGNAGTATKAPESLPSITNEQVKKLDVNSTYADFEKIVGKNLKPIKEENGKKTYEVKIANETNRYMEVTYTSDGKMLEQKVFMK